MLDSLTDRVFIAYKTKVHSSKLTKALDDHDLNIREFVRKSQTKKTEVVFNKTGVFSLAGKLYFVLPRIMESKWERVKSSITTNQSDQTEALCILRQHIRIMKKYFEYCQKQGRDSSKSYWMDIGTEGISSQKNPLNHFDAAFSIWEDYTKNGFWYHTDRSISFNGKGRIHWTKSTQKGVPIDSPNGFIFRELYRSRTHRTLSHELSQLHIHTCAKICEELLGKAFQAPQTVFDSFTIESILNKYENRLFDDRSVRIYHWLRQYYLFEAHHTSARDNKILGTVCSFPHMWEYMIDFVLGGEKNRGQYNLDKDKIFKSFYRSTNPYFVENNNIKEGISGASYIPDTWFIKSRGKEAICFVLDAKDFDWKENSFPSSKDISKQIMYSYFLTSFIKKKGFQKVRCFNVFAFPNSNSFLPIQYINLHILKYDPHSLGKIGSFAFDYERISNAFLTDKTESSLLDRLLLYEDIWQEDSSQVLNTVFDIEWSHITNLKRNNQWTASDKQYENFISGYAKNSIPEALYQKAIILKLVRRDECLFDTHDQRRIFDFKEDCLSKKALTLLATAGLMGHVKSQKKWLQHFMSHYHHKEGKEYNYFNKTLPNNHLIASLFQKNIKKERFLYSHFDSCFSYVDALYYFHREKLQLRVFCYGPVVLESLLIKQQTRLIKKYCKISLPDSYYLWHDPTIVRWFECTIASMIEVVKNLEPQNNTFGNIYNLIIHRMKWISSCKRLWEQNSRDYYAEDLEHLMRLKHIKERSNIFILLLSLINSHTYTFTQSKKSKPTLLYKNKSRYRKLCNRFNALNLRGERRGKLFWSLFGLREINNPKYTKAEQLLHSIRFDSFHDIILACNTLSTKHGLEVVYEKKEQEEYLCFPERTGFRLPFSCEAKSFYHNDESISPLNHHNITLYQKTRERNPIEHMFYQRLYADPCSFLLHVEERTIDKNAYIVQELSIMRFGENPLECLVVRTG